MKKTLAVLAVLVLVAGLSTSAVAERFGKPGATLAKGQWSIGLEYDYIEEEIDLQLPQGWDPEQLGETQAVRNQVLVRLGYGLTDKLEAVIKMGGTSSDISDMFFDDVGNFNEDLNGNMEFTIVGGLNYTIIQEGNFTLGINGTLSWFSLNDDHASRENLQSRLLTYQGIDADVFKVEGALMASYQMGNFTPYGGVVMAIHDADIRYRWMFPAAPTPLMVDIDSDQEDWFGMVVGVNCEVVENLKVGLELTHVAEGVGLSVGVNCAL